MIPLRCGIDYLHNYESHTNTLLCIFNVLNAKSEILKIPMYLIHVHIEH